MHDYIIIVRTSSTIYYSSICFGDYFLGFSSFSPFLVRCPLNCAWILVAALFSSGSVRSISNSSTGYKIHKKFIC